MLPSNVTSSIDRDFTLTDGTSAVRAVFGESEDYPLAGYEVTVIADTKRPAKLLDFLTGADGEASEALSPQRVTTIVAKFPRCILAELNTHRVFSRNSASSRARSIKVVIADVMEDPYIPIFTKNQKGMGGPIVDPETQRLAAAQWLNARDSAVASVLGILSGKNVTVADLANGGWKELTEDYYQKVYLNQEDIPGSLNLHKQNINRLLEPYMWHEAVITSTEWTNFIELRDHDEADPAIHGIARLIVAALEHSTPVERVIHAPFAGSVLRDLSDRSELMDLRQQLSKVIEACSYSAGAAAQVSYRPVAGGNTGADPAKLAQRLLTMAHLSPFEHAAISSEWLYSLGLTRDLGSNLSGYWTQYRSLLAFLEERAGTRDLDSLLKDLI